MTQFLIYPGIDDDHKFPPEINQAIADSPEVGAKFMTRTELNATYVRFVDLAGNPISARHVTIKVDTSTWEISDIVAEP